jgi:macrolide transport system ATP-binding/permease protein
MLQVSDLTKSYGYHQVLNGVSFVLNAGQHLGIVGANGAGKSTLLKIITGEVLPDSGTVMLQDGAQLGYMAQKIENVRSRSVDDLINEALADLRSMEARMRQLEAQMTTTDGGTLDAVLAEYGDVADAFERHGGYEINARVDAVLDGLRIGGIPRDRSLATLSGGEKSRLALAALLLQSPDVLLLDEPTNHLDFSMMAWLEAYLQAYRGAVLIVSHDRHFLNQTVSVIVEIDEHTRTSRQYTGDYDAYHAAKIRERRKWERDFAEQQAQIKQLQYEIKVGAHRNDNYRTVTDNDKSIRNAKIAKHDATVAKRIRSAEERLNRILADPILRPPEELAFAAEFDAHVFEGRFPIEVRHVSKVYGDRTVLCDVSFALESDQRIVLVGPNGAGKSTLLRMILGLEQPDSGEVYVSPAARIGYLDQEQRLLDSSANVFDAYSDGLPGHEQQLKAILLSMGLFRYDDLNKRVGELSSGQQRKLQIARLIAGGYNLLILDEPTNDVSFDVVEGLESALAQFPGPIIAASHDRRFIQQFGGDVWQVENGHIEPSTMDSPFNLVVEN